MKHTRRSAGDAFKSVVLRQTGMTERPTVRSEGGPTVREQLEYARTTIDDMLIDLDNGGVNELDARHLLRAVEGACAQVSMVEVEEQGA